MRLLAAACLALVACGSGADGVTPAAAIVELDAGQGAPVDAASSPDAYTAPEQFDAGGTDATDAGDPQDASDAAPPVDAWTDAPPPPPVDAGHQDAGAQTDAGLGWSGACSSCYATPLPALCDSTHFTFKCPASCQPPPAAHPEAGLCFDDVEPGGQTIDWCCPK